MRLSLCFVLGLALLHGASAARFPDAYLVQSPPGTVVGKNLAQEPEAAGNGFSLNWIFNKLYDAALSVGKVQMRKIRSPEPESVLTLPPNLQQIISRSNFTDKDLDYLADTLATGLTYMWRNYRGEEPELKFPPMPSHFAAVIKMTSDEFYSEVMLGVWEWTKSGMHYLNPRSERSVDSLAASPDFQTSSNPPVLPGTTPASTQSTMPVTSRSAANTSSDNPASWSLSGLLQEATGQVADEFMQIMWRTVMKYAQTKLAANHRHPRSLDTNTNSSAIKEMIELLHKLQQLPSRVLLETIGREMGRSMNQTDIDKMAAEVELILRGLGEHLNKTAEYQVMESIEEGPQKGEYQEPPPAHNRAKRNFTNSR